MDLREEQTESQNYVPESPDNTNENINSDFTKETVQETPDGTSRHDNSFDIEDIFSNPRNYSHRELFRRSSLMSLEQADHLDDIHDDSVQDEAAEYENRKEEAGQDKHIEDEAGQVELLQDEDGQVEVEGGNCGSHR